MHTSVNVLNVQKSPVTTKYEATIGSRGGIQIPIEVRKRLNLKPNDKVVFRVTDQEITVDAEPAVTLENLYGSVTAKEPITQDVDEMIREAREEHRDTRYKRIMNQ